MITPRARRYPIEVAVRYRPTGSETWHDGQAINISTSGVLFTAPSPVPAESAIELVFEMSRLPFAGADIACEGRVVRTLQGSAAGDGSALAATIVTYRFARRR